MINLLKKKLPTVEHLRTTDKLVQEVLSVIGSLGARPNISGAKSRELGLGLETLAAFPCALVECGQSQ